METHHQSEVTESLCTYVLMPHFKLETIQNLKNVQHQGDFTVMLDLKDVLSNGSRSRGGSETPKVHLEGQSVQIHYSTLGLAPAPLIFTKLFKASSALSTTTEHQDHDLLGRYPHHGSLS